MSEFDYLSRVSIGQYVPGGSALHRLDPRAKLFMAIIWIGAGVASRSLPGLSLGLLIVALGYVLAGTPIRYALRTVRATLPFLLLLALLQVFMTVQGAILWQWWRLSVSVGGIIAAAVLLWRFALLILTINLLSSTTTTVELMHGLESALRPLQRLGLPAHEIALTFEIALRSVPMLAQEAERIAKSQAARGGGTVAGKGGIARRVNQTLPLLVPLFISALGRAERLALAMEARGYMGGEGRSHLIELRATWRDWALLLLAAALAVLVVI